ncbi:STAS domain-containing protein [Streptomyces sp. NPDC085946]|uniref:STAS domain-containing protein n=1 Tax=Streptomyces sp. NPDC085946 TaxID=3365744 RepID=UPI0037D3E516
MPDYRDDQPATSDTFTVHTEPLPGGFLLTLAGALDHHTSGQLTDTLQPVLQTAAPTVWLDLAGLSFIDSTGLTCLLYTNRAVAAAGGHTVLIAPSPPVQRMLDITGIGQIFPIHPDHRTAGAAHGRQNNKKHGVAEEAE